MNKKYLIAIIAVASAALALAAFLEDLAAAFIVIIGSAIFWQNHKIEMKLNRLLARTSPDEAIEQCFGAGPIWG